MQNTRNDVAASEPLPTFRRPHGSRRQFLAGAAGLVVASCHTPDPAPPQPGPGPDLGKALIDGHCHLFNAKDLSTVRFLSYVVAKHYPKQAQLQTKGVEDPDLVDRVFEVLLAVVGANRAPTAVAELAFLEGHPLQGAGEADRAPQSAEAAQSELADRLTAFLGGRSFLDRTPNQTDLDAEAALRDLIVRSAGDVRTLDRRGVPQVSAAEQRAIVLKVLAGPPAATGVRAKTLALQAVYLPGAVEFVKQLKRYRHQLVDELAHLHRDTSHQDPKLLVPAMVDFGRWLRDDPDKGSTFADQVRVWPAISRRPAGPAVHGYVAYCPLRQVEFQMGRFKPGKDQIKTACGDTEPLTLVEEALSEHGFVGVKVYPPMGFRAATNAVRTPHEHAFPEAVLKDVYGHLPKDKAETDWMYRDLGGKLDQAMVDLAVRVRKHDGTIMAHGGNSVGANCDTGELADPYYWKPLFDLKDAPPIMLAHFGSFAYWSADPNAPGHVAGLATKKCETRKGPVPFENTWEAWLARYVQDNPGKPVFADMSYFSEALSAGREAEALTNFKKLNDAKLTAIREHLVFGTDWVMLAQEKNAQVYSERVRSFIYQAFGQDWVEPIMRTNFLRYASLQKTSPTFTRLAKVYNGDAALSARLAAACS